MADVSRQSWIDNTSLENVRIADRVFVLLNQASEYVYAPGYTQSYIGVRSGGKACNFFVIIPKKKDSVISIRVTQTAETDAAVKAASTDGTFQYKDGWYGVHLDPNGDHAPLIPVLLQAEKEFKKEKGNAALTKTSEWKEAAAEMAELEKNAQMETTAMKAELERIQAETAKAKAEAAAALEKQKAEAEAAKAELARIQAETEKAKAEAAKAKEETAKAAAEQAKADKPAATTANKGVLQGLFSVAANKKVRFSMGNLQFNPKKYEFRFALHQYDRIGNDNTKIAPNYDGWIDLFGYGTSGYMGCEPTETNTGNQYRQDDIANTNYDWGVYNPISNGGNKEGLWRTLTKEEWNFLFSGRANAAKLLAKACVNGINGAIILPDDFYEHRVRVPFDSTPDGFAGNTYDLSQWATLEAAGAIFLPCCGKRKGIAMASTPEDTWVYWTSSGYNGQYNNVPAAYYVDIFSSYYYGSYFGRAVRLVQDVK